MHSTWLDALPLAALPLAMAATTAVGQVTLMGNPGAGAWVPARVGTVNDFAHVISTASAARITHIADDVRARFQSGIVVVTIPELPWGERSLAEARMRLAERWSLMSARTASVTRETYRLERGSAYLVLLVTQPFAPETHHAGPASTDVDFSDEPRELDLPSADRLARAGDFSTAAELLVARAAMQFARDLKQSFDLPLNADSVRRLERERWRQWVLENRRQLAQEFGPFDVTSAGSLSADISTFRGRQVGMCATFSHRADSTTAVINGALLTDAPPAQSARGNRRRFVIARVLGQRGGAPLLRHVASRDHCEYYLSRDEMQRE